MSGGLIPKLFGYNDWGDVILYNVSSRGRKLKDLEDKTIEAKKGQLNEEKYKQDEVSKLRQPNQTMDTLLAMKSEVAGNADLEKSLDNLIEHNARMSVRDKLGPGQNQQQQTTQPQQQQQPGQNIQQPQSNQNQQPQQQGQMPQQEQQQAPQFWHELPPDVRAQHVQSIGKGELQVPPAIYNSMAQLWDQERDNPDTEHAPQRLADNVAQGMANGEIPVIPLPKQWQPDYTPPPPVASTQDVGRASLALPGAQGSEFLKQFRETPGGNVAMNIAPSVGTTFVNKGQGTPGEAFGIPGLGADVSPNAPLSSIPVLGQGAERGASAQKSLAGVGSEQALTGLRGEQLNTERLRQGTEFQKGLGVEADTTVKQNTVGPRIQQEESGAQLGEEKVTGQRLDNQGQVLSNQGKVIGNQGQLGRNQSTDLDIQSKKAKLPFAGPSAKVDYMGRVQKLFNPSPGGGAGAAPITSEIMKGQAPQMNQPPGTGVQPGQATTPQQQPQNPQQPKNNPSWFEGEKNSIQSPSEIIGGSGQHPTGPTDAEEYYTARNLLYQKGVNKGGTPQEIKTGLDNYDKQVGAHKKGWVKYLYDKKRFKQAKTKPKPVPTAKRESFWDRGKVGPSGW